MKSNPHIVYLGTIAIVAFSLLRAVPSLAQVNDAKESETLEADHNSEDAQKHTDTSELHDNHTETIFIYADPLQPNLVSSATPVSVKKREELLFKAAPSLGETITNEPGVSSTYFGPGSSRPVIRGNSGERIRVLKNGVGTLDVSNLSEDHAVTIDPYTIEQAEVLRGPETLLYGSSAIGGVVNITDSAIPEKAIGVPASGEADYRMGTGDDEISGGGQLKGELGRWNWSLSGFYRDTNDVDIPGSAESQALRDQEAAEGEAHEEEETRGTLENSFTLTRTASAGASYVWEKGFIGAAVSTYRTKYGIPGHSHEHEEGEEHGEDEEFLEEMHEHLEGEDHLEEEHEHLHAEEEEAGVAIDLEQVRLDVRGEVRDISGFIDRIRFRAGASNYDHKELEGTEVGTTFENDGVESRVEAVQREQNGIKGVLGLQVQAQDFTSEGEEAFIPSNTTFSPAVFVFEEFALNDNWKLQAGGRTEYSRINPEDFANKEFYPFSISAGSTYDPTGYGEYTSGLSLTYAQRAPTATELFADGAHIARQIVERGDQTLDEEQSWGTDLTFKKNTGVATGVLNLFYQRYEDFINLSGNGEEEDGFPVFVYEDVRAEFWGFEAESTLHTHELLGWYEHLIDFDAGVDFVRARNLSDAEDLPRIPPLRTTVRARYDWKDIIGGQIEGIFVKEQDDLAPFELKTEDYQLLNASVHCNLAATKDAKLTLYVSGLNLTDEEARVHASFIKDLAPLPGRTFLFGLRGTF